MEECKDILDDLNELDSKVNSAFYLVSSLVHKTIGNAKVARERGRERGREREKESTPPSWQHTPFLLAFVDITRPSC